MFLGANIQIFLNIQIFFKFFTAHFVCVSDSCRKFILCRRFANSTKPILPKIAFGKFCDFQAESRSGGESGLFEYLRYRSPSSRTHTTTRARGIRCRIGAGKLRFAIASSCDGLGKLLLVKKKLGHKGPLTQ